MIAIQDTHAETKIVSVILRVQGQMSFTNAKDIHTSAFRGVSSLSVLMKADKLWLCGSRFYDHSSQFHPH